MNIRIKSGFIAFGLIVLSCGTKVNNDQQKLPKLTIERMQQALDSIGMSRPSFLSTKVDTKYADNKQNLSFKTSLKIQQDSAVHSLISFAGIPIITVMISTDSVKVSNKKEKCFILEDLDFFKERFGINFSLETIEDLFMGRPIGFSSTSRYFVKDDPYNYVVSNFKDNQYTSDVLISYHLSSDLKHVNKLELTSLKDEVTIVIDYLGFYFDGSYAVPNNITINIKTPKNEIITSMVYDKIELNVPKEMIIVIPESYEKCK